jgi:hypothetical protein
MDGDSDLHGEVDPEMNRKTYRKPELKKLGLLRKLTRMSW